MHRLQGQPATGPRHHEEEGHAPRSEKRDEDRDGHALLGVLDVPAEEIKGMDGVEEEDADNRQHPQPVQVVQANVCFGMD